HKNTTSETVKKIEHPKQAKNLRTDNQKSRGHKHSWNRKACFVCKSLNHLIKDCDYYEKQMVQKPVWNNVMRVNHQNLARITHPHSNRNVVPTSVLTRSRLVSLNTARPVPTAVPQTTVKSPRPIKHVVNKAHLPIRRLINHIPATKNSNFNKKVTTVKVNKGNPHQTLKDKGVIDSGRSIHMTGNISFLSDFEDFNGGYVAFRGNPKGDTECVVLSSDIKLSDENYVLLTVPKENNMYNVDLKNVVPSGDLTCLFKKATLDESNIWHRRIRHINFKIMNKLVKGNLVRGLPLKLFENNHTCVACQKGKQHRASWNQPNHNAGIKENLDAENENEVHVSPSGSDKTKKHDDKAKRDAKGKSHVGSPTGVRDLRAEFDEFSFNNTNRVNAASAPVNAAGPNPTNNTNSFNTASPSDIVVSLNFRITRKSLFVDPSTYPDDPEMPELEDIVYSDDEEDVGAEADFSNLETNISVSSSPTTKVHNDHHVTQIIGNLTSAPQTRSMERVVKEQGGLNQINDEDFHTCMFACFLSQEEPKKVQQALTDPSWIEAMQEELL
nr:hypothetical protein [Tanacetum cinerariifolium]